MNIRNLRLRSAAVGGALLAAFLVVAPVAAQHGQAGDRKIIEKESKPGEGRKLDASGLTNLFDTFKNMLRSVATAEVAGGAIEVHGGRLPTMGIDYETFKTLDSGLVEFQTAGAIRLRSEPDLQFGKVKVPAGNLSPGFPGSYSLWLKKVSDDDWRLIINNHPDAWGTMHDPAKDVGEVKLSHELEEGAKATFMIQIEPSDGGGTLKLAWGEHAWQVPFTAGS